VVNLNRRRLVNLSVFCNIYKAQEDIYASCIIESSASLEFICGDDIILEDGFRVDLGGSVIFYPGTTVSCP